jgi:hypothetical protein
MSERKPSARRPSKDDDEDAPSPKKKDSGKTPIKKKTSSRKVVDEDADDDEEEDPKPKKKGSSARSSARSASGGGGGGARPGGPDKGKIFLYFVPGAILILLGLGWYVANMDPPKKAEVIKISYDDDIAKARGIYQQAKSAYNAGSQIEGEGGVPKLQEAKKFCEDAKAIIDHVREELEKLEAEEAKKGGEAAKPDGPPKSYAFEDVDQNLNQLLVMTRKAILERK